MANIIFPAIAQGDQAAGYSATFPDLPGCTAHGADPAELLARARDALRDHLTRLSQTDQDWPEPTPLEKVVRPDGVPTAQVLLIDVQIEETPVRVNISIGERLLKRIDAAAERRGMTRSGFIAASARTALGDGPQGPVWNHAEWEAASRRLQDEFTTMGRKLAENLGPDSTFARNMADLDDKLTDTIRRTADSVAAAVRRRQAERHPADAAAPADEPPRPNA